MYKCLKIHLREREKNMKIQSIQTPQQNRNKSFGSVKISRTFGDVFAVTIKSDKAKNKVSFTDYKEGVKLENFTSSMSAKALTDMLEKLNEKILNPWVGGKVRGLASGVVDDILPIIDKEILSSGKAYQFNSGNNIENLRTSIAKGDMKYSKARNSLRIVLNPNEKVSATIEVSRKALSDIGIKQP